MSHSLFGTRVRLFIAAATICGVVCLVCLAWLLSQQQQEQSLTVGVEGCRDCHSTKTIGDQYSVWLNAKHSQAYQTLLTQKAKDIAKEKGMDVPPHTSSNCLRCHVTGFLPKSVRLDMFDKMFNREEGVGCESCHGPGSLYRTQDIMIDRQKAMAKGLNIPDEKTCIGCHNTESPTFKSFNYDESWKKIEHPIPKEPPTDKGIPWLPTMEQGIAAAQKETKPLVISYWFLRGCPICEGLIPTFSDAAVVEAAKVLVPVRLVNPTHEFLEGLDLFDAGTRFTMPDGYTIVKDMYGSYPPVLLLHVIERVKTAVAAEAAFKAAADQAGGVVPASFPVFHPAQLTPEALESLEFAYQNLARVGDQYLNDARKVLERHGAAAMDEALLSWLWSPRSRVKAQALRLISFVHPAGSDFFYDLLAFAFDPADDLRLAALEGLARMRDKRALESVAKWLLSDHNRNVAEKAFVVLARLGDAGATARLVEFFKKPRCCYEETCPFRYEALVTLFYIDDPAMVGPVTEIARKYPLFRALAIAVLGERRDASVVPFLLDCASDSEAQFPARNEAIFALEKILRAVRADGKTEPKKANDLETKICYGLLPVLRTAENAELRASVCEVFGWLSAGGMVPELVRSAKEDPSEIPRAYAAAALVDIFAAPGAERRDRGVKREDVVALADAAVASPGFLERNMAIDALYRLGVSDYVPLLRDALKDKQSRAAEDRKALTVAAKILAKTGDIEAIPLLVAVLDDEDLDTSRVAILCLEKLSGHAMGDPGAVPMDIPRILLAGANAPSVANERMSILRAVRSMNLGWTTWWQEKGEGHMQRLRSERAQVAALTHQLTCVPVVYHGADPEEFSLWLRLRFSAGDAPDPAMPLMARGKVRIFAKGNEQGVVPGAAPAAEVPLEFILNDSAWQEVMHDKYPQGNEIAPSVEWPHSWQGDLYIRVSSGFKTEEENHPGFVVEFLGGAGSARAEVGPFKY